MLRSTPTVNAELAIVDALNGTAKQDFGPPALKYHAMRVQTSYAAQAQQHLSVCAKWVMLDL
jgi:hypothetical protein